MEMKSTSTGSLSLGALRVPIAEGAEFCQMRGVLIGLIGPPIGSAAIAAPDVVFRLMQRLTDAD
jgi:hypothetical protein